MKEIRELLGLTQQELASWLGLATSTIHRWERGDTVPAFTVGQFLLLLNALAIHGLTVNDLDRIIRLGYSKQ